MITHKLVHCSITVRLLMILYSTNSVSQQKLLTLICFSGADLFNLFNHEPGLQPLSEFIEQYAEMVLYSLFYTMYNFFLNCLVCCISMKNSVSWNSQKYLLVFIHTCQLISCALIRCKASSFRLLGLLATPGQKFRDERDSTTVL